MENFDLKSSQVGYVLNNNSKDSRNGQKWLQVRLKIYKHSKWKKKHFFLKLPKFWCHRATPKQWQIFRKLDQKGFCAKPPTWAKVEVASIKFSKSWGGCNSPYSLVIGKEQLSSICKSKISLDSTFRLDKVLITSVFLSISFRKLQVIKCFRFCKNAQIMFLIMSANHCDCILHMGQISLNLVTLAICSCGNGRSKPSNEINSFWNELFEILQIYTYHFD